MWLGMQESDRLPAWLRCLVIVPALLGACICYPVVVWVVYVNWPLPAIYAITMLFAVFPGFPNYKSSRQKATVWRC